MPDDFSARPERKATIRLGQRELSRISLAVVVAITAGLLFAGYRVFLGFKSQRDITLARANLHTIGVGLSAYAQDWNGKLPPADRWQETVAGFLPGSGGHGGVDSLYSAPGDGANVGYVYNELAAGYNIEPIDKEHDRQKTLPLDQLILVIERTGAPLNSHVLIPPQGDAQGEDALAKLLDFPHFASDPQKATTVLLYANGTVVTRTKQDFTH